MMFTLTPAVPADGYGDALVPLDALKLHLRVDGDEEDDLIAALRDAAINLVEQFTGVRLGRTTGNVARFESFGARMRVGVGPIATMAVTAITYTDSTGASVDLADGDWRVDAGGSIVPRSGTCWPSGAVDVLVTFDAGYADGACPPALLQAVRLFAGHLYTNRSTVIDNAITAEIPFGVTALCSPYRMVSI